jgi:hypothetical protein
VTIGKEISSRYSLVGRNTNVHEGVCEGAAYKVAVKFSQPLRSRTMSEWNIIQRAKERHVTGIPEVRHYKACETFCSRLRGEVFGGLDADAPAYENRLMTLLISKLYGRMCDLSGDKYLKPFQEAMRCESCLHWGSSLYSCFLEVITTCTTRREYSIEILALGI